MDSFVTLSWVDTTWTSTRVGLRFHNPDPTTAQIAGLSGSVLRSSMIFPSWLNMVKTVSNAISGGLFVSIVSSRMLLGSNLIASLAPGPPSLPISFERMLSFSCGIAPFSCIYGGRVRSKPQKFGSTLGGLVLTNNVQFCPGKCPAARLTSSTLFCCTTRRDSILRTNSCQDLWRKTSDSLSHRFRIGKVLPAIATTRPMACAIRR